MARGDRPLDGTGGAAQGCSRRLPAQGFHLPVRLARHEGSGRARAQARSRAKRVPSGAGAGRAKGDAGPHGAVRCLPGSAAIRMAQPQRRDSRREAAFHGGRHRGREGLVRPFRRHSGPTACRRGPEMNWSGLDWGILGLPMIAGLLVLATHVPLGSQVLERGIVFIDLAIAQIAGLGVIAADALGVPEGSVAVQAAALCAAQIGALVLTWTESRMPQQQEALIGVMFILAACAGILLLASNPHGGEHLQNLLVGQILWVNKTQLLWLAMVSVPVVVALWLGWVQRLGRFAFYGAFALAITASVQLVGVYLVFSSLIMPALATRVHRGARRTAIGYGLGAAGYALGLALSALFDLPSGAVIVCTLAICAMLGALALRPAHLPPAGTKPHGITFD